MLNLIIYVISSAMYIESCKKPSDCKGNSNICAITETENQCHCGSNAACSGTTDSCSNDKCFCGQSPACSGDTDTCVVGTCKCGTNPPCTGRKKHCVDGICTAGKS